MDIHLEEPDVVGSPRMELWEDDVSEFGSPGKVLAESIELNPPKKRQKPGVQKGSALGRVLFISTSVLTIVLICAWIYAEDTLMYVIEGSPVEEVVAFIKSMDSGESVELGRGTNGQGVVSLQKRTDSMMLSAKTSSSAQKFTKKISGQTQQTPHENSANLKKAKQPSIVNSTRSGRGARRGRLSADERAKVPENPYWVLPNYLVTDSRPMGRPWTSLEQESWRAGLASRFNYQRYKTVLEVRDMRLAGSEVILQEALFEPKLWTRMRAVMALADFGFEVSLDEVEKAMGNASNATIAKFLKRFIKHSTEGERFVMRQLIRLLDERGRLIVLRAHVPYPSKLRDLYSVAAEFDPGRKVSRWVARFRSEIHPDNYFALRRVLTGEADFLFPDTGAEQFSSEEEAEEGGVDELGSVRSEATDLAPQGA